MRILAGLTLVSALAFGGDHDNDQLDWLIGCWASADKSTQEVWVIDSDRSFVGFNIVLSDNKVDFYEVLSIRRDNDNALVYTPHPFGQASVPFVATQISDNEVVFTNPDHDYPQEIRYLREGNRLLATISLLGGKRPNSFDKVACE